MRELAQLLWALDCVDALNLDGGGSTTMWLESGGVVNFPCDNRRFDHAGERTVANAVLVFGAAVVVLDEDEAACSPGASWTNSADASALDGDCARSAAPDAQALFLVRLPRAGRFAVECLMPALTTALSFEAQLAEARTHVRAAPGRHSLTLGAVVAAAAGDTVEIRLSATGGEGLAIDALRLVEQLPDGSPPAGRDR